MNNVEGDMAIKPEELTFNVFERRDHQVIMKGGKTSKDLGQRVGERKKGEGGIVPRIAVPLCASSTEICTKLLDEVIN